LGGIDSPGDTKARGGICARLAIHAADVAASAKPTTIFGRIEAVFASDDAAVCVCGSHGFRMPAPLAIRSRIATSKRALSASSSDCAARYRSRISWVRRLMA
jgi:hypothetical protein